MEEQGPDRPRDRPPRQPPRPLRGAGAGDRRPAALDQGRGLDLGQGPRRCSAARRRRPKQLIDADPQELRDAGLSWSKVAYVRDLAEHVRDGELDLERLPELADEDVIAELTEVKGIGRWTAEMFLIFHLGRPDVTLDRRPRHPPGGADRLRARGACPSPRSSSGSPRTGARTARSPASTSGARSTTRPGSNG